MKIRTSTLLLGLVILAGLPGVSSAVVTPDRLSGLKLWLKADSLALGGGANVSTWADSSGLGNDAVSFTGGSYSDPTLQYDDVAVVQFSGSATELMEAANIAGDTTITDGTIIAIYKVSDDSNDIIRPIGFGSIRAGTAPGSNMHWDLAADPSLRFDGSNIGPSNYSESHPVDEFLVRTSIKTGQVFNEYFYEDQVLTNYTHGSTLSVVDEFNLGDLHTNNTAATADLVEVIVYDRAITQAEGQALAGYVTAKYYSNAYYRFENGTAGQADSGATGNVLDFTFHANDGTAISGNSSSLPVYSSSVAKPVVPLTKTTNTLSLDFERDDKNYVEVANDDSISFGDNAFTLEAWVKLETLASETAGTNSRQYVLFKKETNVADTYVDYGLLAQKGNLGGSGTASSLALVLGGGSAGGSSTTIGSSLEIDDYEWHYISAAFDPDLDLVRFVLDGQVETITGVTFTPGENDGPLIIGGHFNSAGTLEITYDGLIDELRITGGFLGLGELLYVPEPSTLALLASGLLLALAARRRRRKR